MVLIQIFRFSFIIILVLIQIFMYDYEGLDIKGRLDSMG
jgi:hypothetical protein